MNLPFCFPAGLIVEIAGSGRGEELGGETALRPVQDPFSDGEFGKISLTRQIQLPEVQIADSIHANVVAFHRAHSKTLSSASDVDQKLRNSFSPVA